jgi:hypothetical protein
VDTPDAELIRGEIAAVRGEMDETLGAIARRIDVAGRARTRAQSVTLALHRASVEARRPGPGPAGRPADLADRWRRIEAALRGRPLAWAMLIWGGAAALLLLARILRA